MTQKSVLSRPVVVPASQTDSEVIRWGATPSAQVSCRVSVFCGQVAGTVDLALQDSQSYEIWNAVKATTIGASTDKTCTFVAASPSITSAGHGFTVGQWITFATTGALPPEILAGVPYIVSVATLNTFQIRLQEAPSSPTITPSTTGSGTNTACLIREATITVQAEAAADQTVTPLRGGLRLLATTGGGESVQIVNVQASF